MDTCRVVLPLMLLLSTTTGAMAQTAPAAPAAPAGGVISDLLPSGQLLPPSEEGAKDALNRSPRHGEWVKITLPGSAIPLSAFVVYPERPDKASAIIVIHEIYGLSDWIRAVADRIAGEGFIAVAPDLVSGLGAGGGGTDSVATRDDVVKLVQELTPEETVRRLNAVHDYAVSIAACNGSLGTIGFCWGGTASFAYAAAQPDLGAAVVYYGTSPAAAALAKVKAPVLGLYGGSDARVNVTIEPAVAEMKKLGKIYTPYVYEGAGHGFLRQQMGQGGANRKAAEQAWPRTIDFLRDNLP